jgi:hypothetical protein
MAGTRKAMEFLLITRFCHSDNVNLVLFIMIFFYFNSHTLKNLRIKYTVFFFKVIFKRYNELV